MKFKEMLVLLLVFALLPGVMLAHEDNHEGGCDLVYFFNAWARAVPQGAPNSAVFGLLVNLSGEQYTLLSASSDAAEAVELHEMLMGENDVMQMRPVEGGFVIPPNSYLALEPGGLHIMLINLKHPLEAGGQVNLLLNFQHVGEIAVTVPVVDLTAMTGDQHGMAEMPEAEMPMDTEPVWDEHCAGIHFVNAWARSAGAGTPNSAVYGLLLNLSAADDTLARVYTDASQAVELHEMLMGENDVMRMRPVEDGFVIPAGGATLLKPGGLHIMLINLNGMLQPGDIIELSLTFVENEPLHMVVPIMDPDAQPMHSQGHKP